MRPPQHPHRRYMPRFNPAASFARWMGRTLTPHEREVITALEARRFHGFPSPRVLVLDPWNESSLPLITQYLRYLDRINPSMRLRSFVVDSTLDAAEQYASGIGDRTLYASCNNAGTVRGHNYHRLLLLNIQDYGPYSPLHGDTVRWRHLYATAVSPITLSPHNLVIIHCKLPRYWVHEQYTRSKLSAALPEIVKSTIEINIEVTDLNYRIKDHNRAASHSRATVQHHHRVTAGDLAFDPPVLKHYITVFHPPPGSSGEKAILR